MCVGKKQRNRGDIRDGRSGDEVTNHRATGRSNPAIVETETEKLTTLSKSFTQTVAAAVTQSAYTKLK